MKSWADADAALKQIVELDLQIASADSVLDQQVLDAKAEHNRITAPLIASRLVRVREMEAFYKTQRRKVEADGKRSIDLVYGRLGMRKGKGKLALLKSWKWNDVLAEVKDRFAKKPDLLKQLVKAKESINKDGVKTRLAEEDLAQIGLRLTQPDEFFYETFPEKVRAAAPPGEVAAA